MAGLKKKKKEKSGNPNLVLIIFLVFFFLISIGLGVWGYYGYAGQEELRKIAKNAKDTLQPERVQKDYYKMLYGDLRIALGDKMDAEELKELNLYRDEFVKPDFGTFKNEKGKEAALELMRDTKVRLGGAKEAAEYPSDFRKQDEANKKLIVELEAKLDTAVKAKERAEDYSAKYTKSRDDAFRNIKELIEKGNAAALAKAIEKFKEFQDLAESNRQLKEDARAEKDKTDLIKDNDDKTIAILKKNLAQAQEVAAKEIGGGPGGRGGPVRFSDGQPLMLDVSQGRALWDRPVGRVTRVDPELRQVSINVGSAHGAKPELTFNVFGANNEGRAEGQLKGTIEIVKVVDANTSIAKITSLYDLDGREILMNVQTRTRVLRESESPIREGDLLFNLFWGTRVAITGYVSITGELSDNPAEQMRQMDDFMFLLRRNGVQVDAYVDLRDGQIKGNINSKTRYLIRGYDLKKEKAAKKADGDGEAPKEASLSATINAAGQTLRNEAKERGLILVSSENFGYLIGFRRARSANSVEYSGFRPSLPYVGNRSDDTVRPAPQEKKGPEMEKN